MSSFFCPGVPTAILSCRACSCMALLVLARRCWPEPWPTTQTARSSVCRGQSSFRSTSERGPAWCGSSSSWPGSSRTQERSAQPAEAGSSHGLCGSQLRVRLTVDCCWAAWASLPFSLAAGDASTSSFRTSSLPWGCREHAPSIIFMDEIDSIGSARMESGNGNGDSEVQRTMLELLNQLDGFEATNQIKVRSAPRHRWASADGLTGILHCAL